LHQQKVPLKVVYIGNRHESTLVVRNDLDCKTLSDMAGRTIAVPIRYSGHLLALKRYLREQRMPPESFRIVEISPPDMVSALATGGIDGYFVGEPFAAKAIQAGRGRRLLNGEDIWPKFICNLVIVRDELIRSHPDWVQSLVSTSIRSCLYAKEHPDEMERIVTPYWGQQPEVVSFAFSNPPGRIRFDLYVPVLEEMEQIAEEMRAAGLLQGRLDLREIVEPGFALSADTAPASSFEDVMPR
jgi:NitT/TauT family transport system substrate-binding protein